MNKMLMYWTIVVEYSPAGSGPSVLVTLHGPRGVTVQQQGCEEKLPQSPFDQTQVRAPRLSQNPMV